jgi:hypothetical protein
MMKKYCPFATMFDFLNHTSLEKNFFQLQQKLASLERLKGVANLGMIIDARNETNRLELELQMTNNKLSVVENDVSARKQDFIALFNKVSQEMPVSVAVERNFFPATYDLTGASQISSEENRTCSARSYIWYPKH